MHVSCGNELTHSCRAWGAGAVYLHSHGFTLGPAVPLPPTGPCGRAKPNCGRREAGEDVQTSSVGCQQGEPVAGETPNLLWSILTPGTSCHCFKPSLLWTAHSGLCPS